MRILHYVSSLDDKNGGPTRSVSGLASELSEVMDVTILTTETPAFTDLTNGVRILKGKNIFNGVTFKLLFLKIRKYDLIHLHSIWQLSNCILALKCMLAGVPYLVSPRGTLSDWSLKQAKYKKKTALFLYERRVLASAAALLATSNEEAESCRNFNHKIFVVPNGIEDLIIDISPQKERQWNVAFLSRLHVKKGIAIFYDWTVRNENKFTIVVGGVGSTYWNQKFIGLDAKFEGIKYLGQVPDNIKWSVYNNSEIFVLPSYSENFGIVVLEALRAGCYVITTRGTYWGEWGAKPFIKLLDDISAEELDIAIEEFYRLSKEERQKYSEEAIEFSKKFTWNILVKDYIKIYDEITVNSNSDF